MFCVILKPPLLIAGYSSGTPHEDILFARRGMGASNARNTGKKPIRTIVLNCPVNLPLASASLDFFQS